MIYLYKILERIGFKRFIEQKETDKLIKLTLEVLELKKKLADYNARDLAKSKEMPLTPEKLTMMQLGSYVPSFEPLWAKSDEFKRGVGSTCSQLVQSEGWKYLIEHLKQDQVNLYLFNEDENRDEKFVRGSINGIYIVDEQVRTLGMAYDESQKGIN